MAHANFFDKTALGAAQILRGFHTEHFQQRLSSQTVAIVYDSNASDSFEGRIGLSLATDMLARLYPSMSFVGPPECESCNEELKAIARAINPDVDITETLANATMCLSFGVRVDNISTFYIGSDGWKAILSITEPVPIGTSRVPFGIAAASCLATASIFREVFADALPNSPKQGDIELSLLDLTVNPQRMLSLDLGTVDLGKIECVGIGAVGSAATWCLSKCGHIRGDIDLIDPQDVSLSNLQRYVGCTQSDVNNARSKAQIAADRFTDKCPNINARAYPTEWGLFLADRNDWRIETVAVALDTAIARCEVQGALPRIIVNAWTGSHGDVGVSRHHRFGEKACLMCLYLPDQNQPNQDEIVLNALHLPKTDENLKGVRKLLMTGEGLSRQTLTAIATVNHIAPEELFVFEGKPLLQFYGDAVCGGLIMRLREQTSEVEVPMVFQSAMAGVLLAAELVATGAGFRTELPTTTRINMLTALPQTLSFPIARQSQGRCICEDDDFVSVYNEKYPAS